MITYSQTSGANITPYVTKNDNVDGTWTTSTGFPVQLSASNNSWGTQIVALTDGKFFALYAACGTTTKVLGKLWSGSSWGSEENCTLGKVEDSHSYCAVADGDDIYVCFLTVTTYNILSNKRTYGVGWAGSDTTVQASVSSLSYPSLCNADSTLYCFWANSNVIYYKTYGSGSWDSSATTLTDESSETLTGNALISAFHILHGYYVGLLYMTKSASPYYVRFAYLGLTVPEQTTFFGSIISKIEKQKNVVTCDVTYRALSLGSRDSYTGLYAKTYTESTIKMAIFTNDAQREALKMGYWVSLDALGLTETAVTVYSLIRDSLDRVWQIKSVSPITVGDSTKYYKCDLKELPTNA
jgi:hypothetical protein